MTAVVNKSALLSLVASFVPSLASTSFWWAKDPDAFVSDVDAVKVTLSLRYIKQNGIDEHLQSFNDTGDPTTSTLTTQENGQRDVALAIRVEAYDLSAEASEVLDQIRVQFGREVNSASLNVIGLAWQSCVSTTDLAYTIDNRLVNVATMDVLLSGLAGFTFTDAPGTGWVSTVIPPVGTYIP